MPAATTVEPFDMVTTVGYHLPRAIGWICFQVLLAGSKTRASRVPAKPSGEGCGWPFLMMMSYLRDPPHTRIRPSGRNACPQHKKSITEPSPRRKVGGCANVLLSSIFLP